MSNFNVEIINLRDLLLTPEPEWLIQDHIHQREVGVVYGPANVGKSFVMIDWALSVATGTPWLGHYLTKQTPVLYLAGEGAASLNKRVDSWLRFHKQTDAPIYFQTRPLPLREDDVIADIQRALLTAYTEDDMVGDVRPGLIIVDTLSQFMMGGDENGSDMALFVANLRHLSQEQDAAIVIVHHTNKGGIEERGHTALRGNVDVMFSITGKEVDNQLKRIHVLNDKQRDSAKSQPVDLDVSKSHKSLVLSLANPRLVPVGLVGLTSDLLINLLLCAGTIEDASGEFWETKDWLEISALTRSVYFRERDKLLKLKLVRGAGRGKFMYTPLGRKEENYQRKSQSQRA